MQTSSDRRATQIFGLAMFAVFAAMLMLNAVSYWRGLCPWSQIPFAPQPPYRGCVSHKVEHWPWIPSGLLVTTKWVKL